MASRTSAEKKASYERLGEAVFGEKVSTPKKHKKAHKSPKDGKKKVKRTAPKSPGVKKHVAPKSPRVKKAKKMLTAKGKPKKTVEQNFNASAVNAAKKMAKMSVRNGGLRISAAAIPKFAKGLKNEMELMIQNCILTLLGVRSTRAIKGAKLTKGKTTITSKIVNAAMEAAQMENFFLHNAMANVTATGDGKLVLKNVMNTPSCSLITKKIKGKKTLRKKILTVAAYGIDHKTADGTRTFSTCFVFPKSTFKAMLKYILNEYKTKWGAKGAVEGIENIRLSPQAVDLIQYNLEVMEIRKLSTAAMSTDARGGKTIKARDIYVSEEAVSALVPSSAVSDSELQRRVRLTSGLAPKTKILAKASKQEAEALAQEPKRKNGKTKKPKTPLIKGRGLVASGNQRVETARKNPKKLTTPKVISKKQVELGAKMLKTMKEDSKKPAKRAAPKAKSPAAKRIKKALSPAAKIIKKALVSKNKKKAKSVPQAKAKSALREAKIALAKKQKKIALKEKKEGSVTY
jgi:histone H1/5